MTGHVQDTTPVDSEYEDGETSAVQDDADPVKMKEQVLGEFLTMQHAEGRRMIKGPP
jgi:hypothetical protein